MSQEQMIRDNDEIRVVLIGNMGSGKSKVGTTLLYPTDGFDSTASTTSSLIKSTRRLGKTLTVVDTPGLDSLPENTLIDELNKSLDYSSPGPHLFLFCVSMGRSTANIDKVMKIYFDVFGRNIQKHLMFVFTHYDQWLEDMKEKEVLNPDFDDYIKNLPLEVMTYMGTYESAYTILDISLPNKSMQADKIFKSAMNVIERNRFVYFRKTRLKRFKDMCCRLLRGLCRLCRFVWDSIVNKIRRVRYNVI